ncbi:DUF1365 family protein [Microvirga tunisiensis]|uniref:DUF1365 family protein n=1 Tax=Pannonibacter tanglangensis TaxID=2750084 RepID=A0A7X5J804_9HYPH|nr:DUF1365 domain-containing protein [Pannonibacter sp. XCT-53]NBN78062.1 DUF1365 family protein [Pannonibacter sp. XCT-53]
MARKAETTMAENGPPPAGPVTLYTGKVMHARMKPVPHRFTYSVFSLLFDLDRLADADRLSPLLSVGRFNLLSFHARDHGPRDGSDLRAHVDRLLAEAGLARPARVLLLAYPRLLGYVFNPLAVYYAYEADGRLAAVVYEVRNTFGDLHTYVAPVRDGQVSAAGLRQDQVKTFYVSPFLDMQQHYHFRLLPPGRSVRIRILETDPAGPMLSATFNGEGEPATSRAILAACLRFPLMTLKVMAGIHYEALKLWLKGIRFHSRPTPAGATSAGGPAGTPLSQPAAPAQLSRPEPFGHA